MLSRLFKLREETTYNMDKINRLSNAEILRLETNRTLKKLIYNHKLRTKPSPSYISGPKTLSLHTNSSMNMIVYIFGEDHHTTEDCPHREGVMSIDSFLIQLFSHTDAFIDVFFEFPDWVGPQSKWLQPNQLRLHRLYQDHQSCMYKTTHPKCALTRIHYFDVRTGKHASDTTSRFIETITFACQTLDSVALKIFMRDFMKTPNTLVFLQKCSTLEFWQSQLQTNEYVNKELTRSYLNKEIAMFIKEWMQLVFSKQLMLFHAPVAKLRDPSVQDEDIVNAFKTLYEISVPIHACLADAYMLARLFKVFRYDATKPDRPYNVVVYAGDMHSTCYRKFLKWKGFSETRVEKQFSACVSLHDFQMPFFTNV